MSSPSSVSVVARNINGHNKNALFSSHTLFLRFLPVATARVAFVERARERLACSTCCGLIKFVTVQVRSRARFGVRSALTINR
jgi:hypothetical protein